MWIRSATRRFGMATACIIALAAEPRPGRSESLFGTEIWFAWPFTFDVTGNDPAYDLDAELIILAESGAVDVRVVGPGVDLTVTAAPGSPAAIRLPRAQAMVSALDVPVAAGIHLTSQGCERFGALFRVPGSGASVGDDVARLLPVSLLGRKYLPVAYWGKAEFIVVATEDDTTVTITDPNCASPAAFVLQRGEAVLHECANTPVDTDVTGTIVEASAPVAVMSGSANSRVIHHWLGPFGETFFSYADQLFESPWPIDLLGRTHAHAPYRKEAASAIGDLVRVVAGCPGALVDARESDGGTWTRSLPDVGSWSDLEEWGPAGGRLVDVGILIDSNVPIEAAAYTVGNSGAGAAGIGDPSMSILDPVERWERSAVAYLPAGYLHSLAIIAPAAETASVMLDGSAAVGTWQPIGDGTRFSWLRLDNVAAGEHRLSCAEPFLVEVSGYLDPAAPQFAGAYSYPAIPLATPRLLVTGADPCRVPQCPGQCFDLAAPAGVSHSWSTGDTGRTITTCPDQTTTYTVTTTDVNGCLLTGSVTIDVIVVPRAPTISGPAESCEGTCFQLTATAGWDAYAWDGGETTDAITVCPTAPASYGVTTSILQGCTSRAVHDVAVYPPPIPGPAQVSIIDPCRRGLVVAWLDAAWRPGSPGGVYNLYRREGACAPPGDPSWQVLALGLTATTWMDTTTRIGVAYSYLVEAEDAPAANPCRPGPFMGGSSAATCAAPEGAIDPGDPDEPLLISLSPWLRAVGYERVGTNGPCTAVTFTWALAPGIDPRTHAEIWRSERPDLLSPLDRSLPGVIWRDPDPTAYWLYFYKVFNATDCGSIALP